MIELLNELASILIKIVIAGGSLVFVKSVMPWIKKDLIPWLKEKHLYEIVQNFVFAAEKLAESGAIDRGLKKQYVIACLNNKGITVTEEIDALIECAVEELDLAIESGFIMIGDAFEIGEGELLEEFVDEDELWECEDAEDAAI